MTRTDPNHPSQTPTRHTPTGPPVATRPTVHVSRLFVGKFWHVLNRLPESIRLRLSGLVRYWGRLPTVNLLDLILKPVDPYFWPG